MKMLTMIVMLALVSPATAAGIGAQADPDRYVADAMEVVTLPDGEVVTRLVSSSGLTARRWWANSVYPQGRRMVFQGRGDFVPNAGGPDRAQKNASGIAQNNSASNDRLDLRQHVADMIAERLEDKGFFPVDMTSGSLPQTLKHGSEDAL